MKLIIMIFATFNLLLGLAVGDHLWWAVSAAHVMAVLTVVTILSSKKSELRSWK